MLLIFVAANGGTTPVEGGVSNIPQGLQRISKEFGTTISSMAAHVGRMMGPSPAYNGPCQCRGEQQLSILSALLHDLFIFLVCDDCMFAN
jgi:hypothetical protein